MTVTAVAEPQGKEQQPLAEVVALPLPEIQILPGGFGGAAEAPSGSDEWLKAVSLASAKLEQLQWEVDAAEEDLCAALRGASASSVTAAVLATTAGLTPAEIEAYLRRPVLPALDGPPSVIAPA